MIADVSWVKAEEPRIKKLSNRTFIHPLFTPLLSFILAKISFTLG